MLNLPVMIVIPPSFSTGRGFDQVISQLEVVLLNITEWLLQNNKYESKVMKIPSFLSSFESQSFKLDNSTIESSNLEVLSPNKK